MTQTTKYVIKYKLDGQRRWDFALMPDASLEQAPEALRKIHGEDAEKISDIRQQSLVNTRPTVPPARARRIA